MSLSKKLTCKGTLRQVLICLRPRTPYPPPLHHVYVYAVYTYSHREWGEVGRVEPERRLEGLQLTNLGRKIPTWPAVSPVYNSDKHLPKSPFAGQFSLDDDILL
jgi:hypothetical protein